MLTLHGAPAARWQAEAALDYRPESFAHDGFIHTSVGGEALAAALNRHAGTDERPYVALLIDLDRVRAPWEITRYSGTAALFPHLHGPLNRDAVVAVLELTRRADGAFLPPLAG